MENKPKKLILDYSIWHCGDNDRINGLGEGHVALLNNEGYMCCLGQWCEQLGAPKEMLKNEGEPGDVKFLCPPFNYDRSEDEFLSTGTSKLSSACMSINDNKITTPNEKIFLLTQTLEKEGIQLEVINKPETK